jgi:hypothetical protein
MSILRKKGKEKLRFKIMNNRVPNPIFNNLKGLIIKSLNENADITEKLDKYYKLIQIYFFYEVKDPNVVSNMQQTLKDPKITDIPKAKPALAISRKNIGCILIFVKHLEETTQKRTDIENVEDYQKFGLFEELCHLVEQKGNSSIFPESNWLLWNLYLKKNLLGYGNQIIEQLDTDRNHYEVFSMMLKAYPDMWVTRYCKYYSKIEQFRQQYEQQKKDTPIEVVHARLITDFLRNLNFLYVTKKAEKEKLSEKNRELLATLIETGEIDVQDKKKLIERDMGPTALSLIDCIDETVFKTPETFFSVVLDLWKNLKLI